MKTIEIMRAVVPEDEAQVNVLSHRIAKLDCDLKKREVHLAELIDEVLYAEQNKEEAMRRAESARHLITQLEGIFQDLLGYLKLIEGDVLLPAFLELSNVAPQEFVADRMVIRRALENIAEDNLSSRTKKLVAAVKDISSATKNRATREAFLRKLTEESVNVGDAILLSGLLLEKKDELTALLGDLRDRVCSILQGNRPELLGGGRVESTGVNRKTSLDLDDLQEQLRLARGGDCAGFARTPHEDVRRMERKLQDAHERLLKEQSTSQDMMTRIKALELNARQLEREKTLLHEEIRELRCDQSSKGGRSFMDQQRAEEEMRQLRAELDRVIAEKDAKCITMESQITDLRAQNAILVKENQEHNERIEKKVQQIASLQSSNEELRRELLEMRQRMLSSSPSATTYERGGALKGHETTVSALTQELGIAERRMAEASARHEADRNKIIAQFEEERGRYRAERKECDALLERMANELERLAVDNRSLRTAVVLQKL